MRTILFDADVLAYRFGHKGVTDLDLGDGDDAALVDPDLAVRQAKEHLGEVLEDCGADNMVLCWSDAAPYSNFRLDIDCTYKWKRTRDDRPANYYAVREAMTAAFKSYEKPHLEADDVLGILQTAPEGSKVRRSLGETIIVTVDKDLLQVPGLHYNPVTKRRTTVEKVDGDHLHMHQTLAGDPVDNYDGVPRIGMGKAEKRLAEAGLDPVLAWQLVIDCYVEFIQHFTAWAGDEHQVAELTATHLACQQARLAKILQWEDYDMTKKEVKLWLPPKK